MGSTKFSSIDLNKWKKVYPYKQLKPNMKLISDSETQIEAATIDFDNTDRVIHTFAQLFPEAPAVSVTPQASNANVSLAISSVSTTTVTIEASSPFTGSVHLQAIYINCP